MTDTPSAATQIVAVAPARTSWKDWLPVLSLLMVVAASVLTGGGYIAQVKDNTRRVEVLERRFDDRDREYRNQYVAQQERAARMEGKLDLVLERLSGKGAP